MKTFAAIYIGSYEISMKVFELSIKRGIREIDHVRHRMNWEGMFIPRDMLDMKQRMNCVRC